MGMKCLCICSFDRFCQFYLLRYFMYSHIYPQCIKLPLCPRFVNQDNMFLNFFIFTDVIVKTHVFVGFISA